jgi:hypothetical protein
MRLLEADQPVIKLGRYLIGFAAAAMLAPAPVTAAPDPTAINYAAERAAIVRFQQHDQRLQDVGWRLVRSNAAFCSRVVSSIGLQMQDMASYGEPAIARAAIGITGDFAVQTAARGSPADLAGGFTRNREIVRLERFDPNQWEAENRLDWQRLARAHAHVEAMLTEHNGIEITFADGAAIKVSPQEVCATRFELMGGGRRAVADGQRVLIGMEFPAFGYDEDQFAAVVAHELAHNLLDHSGWLEQQGRNRRNVRDTEREADRLMPWLLANAGYDPAAAVRFMEYWGPRHDKGLLRSRTHDSWRSRVRRVRAELSLIAALMEREGRADWARHFQRENGAPDSQAAKPGAAPGKIG